MSGNIPYILVNKVNKVTVPLYDELKPENIIKKMKLKEEQNKSLWAKLT